MRRKNDLSYEDKQNIVVDFLCRLPKERQRDIFKEMPDKWSMSQRTDYLVEKIDTIESVKGKYWEN